MRVTETYFSLQLYLLRGKWAAGATTRHPACLQVVNIRWELFLILTHKNSLPYAGAVRTTMSNEFNWNFKLFEKFWATWCNTAQQPDPMKGRAAVLYCTATTTRSSHQHVLNHGLKLSWEEKIVQWLTHYSSVREMAHWKPERTLLSYWLTLKVSQ